MDGNRGSSSAPRKRGHQHHIRHDGTRRSNVPADEIIAALRAGDTSPALTTTTTTPSSANTEQTHHSSDMGMHLAVDNDNNNIYDGDVTMLNDDDNCNNNNNHNNHNDNTNSNRSNNNRSTSRLSAASRCPVSNVLADSTSEWLNGMNSPSGAATGADPTSTSTQSSTVLSPSASRTNKTKIAASKLPRVSALNEMEKCATKDYDPDQTDSVSSGSSTSNKKSKSKRDSTKKSGKSTSDPNDVVARKEKRKRTKVSLAPPNEERPPLEGAAATDQWNEFDMAADIENDPEAAEWSKLRCTSERTEVVAEREYRRQNRRCADYPGLAFGRSIFSSDTMMKLNIIRNELHNIMKTQLKRVRNTT